MAQTEKQNRFAQKYLLDLNATRAASPNPSSNADQKH